MNTTHQTFLLEYFRTGDKKQAYRKAYPKTKENCITNSVNRLMARADIAEAIREQQQTTRKTIEAEIAERYKAEIIDHYEAQAYLTQIIRGELKRDKWVKKKDHWETIQVTPTISETLRALSIYLKALKAPSGSPQGREKVPNLSCPPPWGELEGASDTPPHPYGNIYPANYRGPYYDPNDPNTKEKMQNLRLDRLTGSPVTTTTHNNKQQQNIVPPLKGAEGDVHTRSTTNNNKTQQPPPVITRNEAISQQQEQAHNTRDYFVAEPPRNDGNKKNDEQHSTTPVPLIAGNNNKTQQSKTSPPCEGGVAAGRGGNTQHGQSQPIHIPPYGADGHYAAKQRAWRIKLEQLRKEGWETANELFNEVHDVFINNQHSGTYKMLKQFEKAVQSRNLPAEEREKIIQETGWEYHPEHPHVMRRRRKLGS